MTSIPEPEDEDALLARLAAEIAEEFASMERIRRYQVFPTLNKETVKKYPGLAWQVVDLTETRTVANCYKQEDALLIASLLNAETTP